MKFIAFIDESGTHAAAPATVVAGYLSTEEMWGRFAEEWAQVLGDFGISRFHMTDFANQSSPFGGWAEDQRRDVLTHLFSVINRNVILPFGAAIRTAEYIDVFGKSDAHKFVGGPYGLAATMCFMNVGDVLNDVGVYGEIDYVFEAGAVGAGQIQNTFNANLEDPGQRDRLHLASLTFRTRAEAPALQAADMVAYEVYREMQRLISGVRSRRYPLRALSQVPAEWGFADREQLTAFRHAVDLRLGLSPDELLKNSPHPVRLGTPVPLTLLELQSRIRWFKQFRGRTHRRTGAA